MELVANVQVQVCIGDELFIFKVPTNCSALGTYLSLVHGPCNTNLQL